MAFSVFLGRCVVCVFPPYCEYWDECESCCVDEKCECCGCESLWCPVCVVVGNVGDECVGVDG